MQNRSLSLEPPGKIEMTGSTASTVAAAGSWTLFGISLAQVNTLLQTIALTLTIMLSAIALCMHGKKAYTFIKDKFFA